jgi:hypothetical protein
MPGDAQAKKLTKQAMEKNYVAKDFSGAVRKLGQAATLCEQKGCTPSVHANIYASLAVVHWNGTEDFDSAVEALRTMVRLDPEHTLDKRLATAELKDALDTAKVDVQVEATQPPDAGARAPQPQEPPDEDLDPAEARERAFKRQVEARKQAYAHEQEEAQKKADQEAARYAAEQKKAEAARKAEEAHQRAEEKKQAARKAAEEKKDAARRAAEAKAADEARRVQEAQRAAEEKKTAAIRAAEDKKAEDARKAEEAKRAKEEERLRTPIKAGKFQEDPWAEQTVGYPLPVYVKLPPPPAGIERERTDVVKVVTEYSGPGTPIPQKFELKALGGGGYGGYLPCDATTAEGVVTYFTLALNKYDNLVAIGGSPQKPNKVKIRATMSGTFPHLPGELPPKSCAEGGGSMPTEAPDAGPPGCTADTDCPDGGICAEKVCATAKAAPPVPSTKPRWRHCFGCELGAQGDTAPWGVVLVFAALATRMVRRRAEGRAE